MAEAAAKTKLTYADYAGIPDDGQRHEIIDGEHFVSPSPRIRHQVVQARLVEMLSHFVRLRRLGWVIAAPLDVVLSPHDVVQPDVLFVSSARNPALAGANLQGPPDLAIEILSPSNPNYDIEIKFRRYERLGVPEYWIVDPGRGTILVFRRDVNGRLAGVAPAASRVQTPQIPGFELDLAELFAELPE